MTQIDTSKDSSNSSKKNAGEEKHSPSHGHKKYRSNSTSTTTSSSSVDLSSSTDDSSTDSSTSSSASSTDSSTSSSSCSERKPRKRLSRSPPQYPAKIHVGKLTRNVSRDHLFEIFSHYGNVKSVDLPFDRLHHHLNRGYAYIQFDKEDEAHRAFKFMNGGMIDGQEVTVALIYAPLRPNTRRSPPSRRSSKRFYRNGRNERRRSPPALSSSRKRRYSRSSSTD